MIILQMGTEWLNDARVIGSLRRITSALNACLHVSLSPPYKPCSSQDYSRDLPLLHNTLSQPPRMTGYVAIPFPPQFPGDISSVPDYHYKVKPKSLKTKVILQPAGHV